MTSRAEARTTVTRACTDRDMREVLLYAIQIADRVQLTKSGIRFYGPTGTAGAHYTQSDHRARANFLSQLRAAGL